MIFHEDFDELHRKYVDTITSQLKRDFEETACIDYMVTIISGCNQKGKLIWACQVIGDPKLSELLGLMEMAKIDLMVSTPEATAISK